MGGISSVQKRFDTTKEGYDELKKMDAEFIESIRGGRESCADSIVFLDATNLYGHIQCMAMPKRSYEFMKENDVKLFSLFFESREKALNLDKPKIPKTYEQFFNGHFESREKLDKLDEEKLDFLLEVNLEIPEKLHDFFADYPVPASKYIIR